MRGTSRGSGGPAGCGTDGPGRQPAPVAIGAPAGPGALSYRRDGIGIVLALVRTPTPAPAVPVLDERQQLAAGYRGGVLRVVGAPGTGKTTVCVESVVGRVREGLRADRALVLTPARTSAAALRQRLTARIGTTTTEPLARTHQGFGFAILRQAAALAGEPTPVLLSGPEQDVVLRELLAGHAAGTGKAPQWPDRVRAALGSRGFRGELRDLLMRAVERGLEPESLARLGIEHDRPDWVAAADVLREYDEVTALSTPGAFDPAWVLTATADLLADDAEALQRVRAGLGLLVVDDAQELTAPAARLLRVLRSPDQDLVLVGDPDTAVQAFRGADPELFARWDVDAEVVLGTTHRFGPQIGAVAGRVAARIGVVGTAGHRGPISAGALPGTVEVRLLRSGAQEASLVAGELRAAHLLGGTPWSQMALIVRGQSRLAAMRRALAAAGVPVSTPLVQGALREEPVARALLGVLDVALRISAGQQDPLTPQAAVDLLTSPIGGADAAGLRRLRRLVRREELDAAGPRSSDALLVQCLLDREYATWLGPLAAPARRLAAMLEAGAAPGANAEHALWAIWAASGLAQPWRSAALAGGAGGGRADHDLDVVRALFHAASAYVDRLPQMDAAGFLEQVRAQDIAADSLLERSVDERVELLTPQAAAGREWRLVVLSGVQEGVWPDLRLRGSLLGSQQLVEILTGRGRSLRAAQAAVRYDETRLFLSAVTRACERVILTAVASEDEQPSVYLDVVDPPGAGDVDADRGYADPPPAMTLPALVGELRRAVVNDQSPTRAAEALARLARHEVRGAHPSMWRALQMVSDDRPVRGAGRSMSLSPSRLGTFEDCSLRWLLTFAGGDGPRIGAASVGTLVHEIAADLGDADVDMLRAQVRARWGRLGLPEGWLSDRQREQAQDMLTRLAVYVSEASGQGWEPVGRELELDVQVGSARIRGRVDRLERGADGLRVVDLKTGSSKPTAGELGQNPQLGAYQVAVEVGAFEPHGHVSAGAALLQVGKAANKATTLQQQPALAAAADPQWAREMLDRAAEGMSASRFSATLSPSCRTCPVRTSCPLQPEGASG